MFVALLTENYHLSEWCDQEFGFVLARPEVVIIPINIASPSYGFLSDHQELRWKTGPYVRHTENGTKLARCLIDRQVVNRGSMLAGLAVAPNFRSADVVVEILEGMFSSQPLTQPEALVLTRAIVGNDQVHNNTNALALFPAELAPHIHAIPREQRDALVKLKFATRTDSYKRY